MKAEEDKFEIGGLKSSDAISIAERKKAELDSKLRANKAERDAARAAKQTNEEEKLPEEDFDLIDQYFSSSYQTLEAKVLNWGSLEGATTEQFEAYFAEVHAEFVKLREYITDYQYAIPTGMFSRYQSTLANFETVFSEQKDLAMPKKKFAFKRKGKTAKPQAAAASTPATEGETGSSAASAKVDEGNHLLIKNV
jgi:hypothetical protein